MDSKKQNFVTKNTSVYTECYVLNEGALTINGYFDLIQIEGLRVYAANIITSKRQELSFNKKEFSKLTKLSYSSLQKMEKGKVAVPLSLLVDLVNDKEKVYQLIQDGKIELLKKLHLPSKLEDISPFIGYLSVRRNSVIIKRIGKEHASEISTLLNCKLYFPPNNQLVLKSQLLCGFINTFFHKVVERKINPPLTDYVKELLEKNVDLRKAVIIPLIQTDGYHVFDKRKRQFYIGFKNTSDVLHNILVDAMYFSYNCLPSSYMLKEKQSRKYTPAYNTRYVGTDFQEIHHELLSLCGNFKTSKYYLQSRESYEIEAKPHLGYLSNATALEKEVALRIWASAEGGITPMKRSSDGLTVPKLQISCANGGLLYQLHKIACDLGIYFNIKREKGRGYKGLLNFAISCALSFLKMGGFIENVKISKSSKYYEGIDKQDILYATLEYMLREREDASLRRFPMKTVHHKIKQIAEKKEYKSVDFYVKYFSQNDKVRVKLTGL